MKLFNVVFDSPQEFSAVRAAAKVGDPRATVTVNEGSAGRSFETQSEKAANTIKTQLGGKIEVIEYDITKLHRD